MTSSLTSPTSVVLDLDTVVSSKLTPTIKSKTKNNNGFHYKDNRIDTITTPTTSSSSSKDYNNKNIQVAVRIRPLSIQENQNGYKYCIQAYTANQLGVTTTSTTATSTTSRSTTTSKQSTTISPSSSSSYQRSYYTFDQIFPSSTDQLEIYDKCVTPLISSCIQGYNATVFAYGQTGSGKTYTILGETSGNSNSNSSKNNSSNSSSSSSSNGEEIILNEGILPRAIKQIFHDLEGRKQKMEQLNNNNDENKTTCFDDNNNIEHGYEDDDYEQSSSSSSSSSLPKSPITSSATSNTIVSFEYQIKIQFLEVYGENIRDLLNTTSIEDIASTTTRTTTMNNTNDKIDTKKKKSGRQHSNSLIKIKNNNNNGSNRNTTRSGLGLRDGTLGGDAEVIGANQIRVLNANEALQYLKSGLSKRIVGKTTMNSRSSRSHVIYTVIIQQTIKKKGKEQTHLNDQKVNVETKTSKIHFVDLSGSERIKKSKTKGQSLKEGIDINKGLLALGNVISALSTKTSSGKKSFVPYRDSKLTRLLKGSIGGNHKTLMIACVSPSSFNAQETVNTLRYAKRAKNIENKARMNVDSTSHVVSELKDQVTALASELLKMKREKEEKNESSSNSDSVENDEGTNECSFSIEFLEGLVSDVNSKSLLKKQEAKVPQHFRLEPIPTEIYKHEDNVISIDEVHVTPVNINTKKRSIVTNSLELEEKIQSHDFTSATLLRETLAGSKHSTPVKHLDEEFRATVAQLRNVDELYANDDNLCHQHTQNQVDKVISDHILNLDDSIAHNEGLLEEMLNEAVNQNNEEIQELKKTIQIMKDQRDLMKRKISPIQPNEYHTQAKMTSTPKTFDHRHNELRDEISLLEKQLLEKEKKLASNIFNHNIFRMHHNTRQSESNEECAFLPLVHILRNLFGDKKDLLENGDK